MRKVRARVRFKGRVQGVGFRHFTTLQAKDNIWGKSSEPSYNIILILNNKKTRYVD